MRHASSSQETTPHVAGLSRRDVLIGGPLGLAAASVARAGAPDGQLTIAVHVSLAPTWFDPAETTGLITPYMILYALHDAVAKPMPGQSIAPSLAKSWSVSEDGLVHEFVLRPGVTFHDDQPVTADDVRFSFERYRGNSHALFKERVARVEALDEHRVRFTLNQVWPDFEMFYGSATGAGWVVPRKYIEKVGDDGFKKAPIGAGPYRFVSFNPGVELTLEAYPGYWRKAPSVKRIVMKVIPDEATRLAALKRGEVDIAFSVRGELAEELERTKELTLVPVLTDSTYWMYFADQWDPKSPWYDIRVRRAAAMALDVQSMNQALTLGFSKIENSTIPAGFDYFWQPPAQVYDPQAARRLLAEAGYPKGFDAGEYYTDSSYSNIAEVAVDNLQAVGIRVQLRPLERAAAIKGFAEKKFRNLIQSSSGAFGNAASRLELFAVKGGFYAYGSYPDIDELFPLQAVELDRAKRTSILHKMQQLVHERAMFAPYMQLAFICGVGPRVGSSSLGRISGFPYTGPYEDLTLKAS